MSNSNYSQVSDLLAAGRLNWQTDTILGFLCTGATFHASDKVIADTGGTVVSVAPIQGRIIGVDRQFLGYAAFFQMVPEGEYQMILVQDVGMEQRNVLSYYDTAGGDDPLVMDHQGTFVLRPGPSEGYDEKTRLWMKV